MSFTLEPDEKQNGAIGKPTMEQVKFHGAKIGLSAEDCEHFWHHYESNGWRIRMTPMKSWRSAMATWKIKGQTFSPAKVNGAARPISIGDLRTVIKAKTDARDNLRRKFRSEGPTGNTWSNEPARQQAIQLTREIEELNNQLARMA